jgi:recombination protein RecR
MNEVLVLFGIAAKIAGIPSILLVAFANAFVKMRSQMQYCQTCHNISDTVICEICNNKNRDASLICVVADFRDVVAIESTNQFKGMYHVLGGLISPMDGIAPSDLNITNLVERASQQETQEVIMALSHDRTPRLSPPRFNAVMFP